MKKRKLLTVLTILIFLLPLLDGLFSLSIFLRETVYAESNVSTIIERDEIKVTYSYEEDSVDDAYVNWKINYQHDVAGLDSRVISAALKFKLVTPLTENQYLDFAGSTFMDNQDGWYRQAEFTPTSEGSFLLRSPKDVPVSLIFQMDTMNLVDRVVEKEVTVEVEKEVEIPQEEIQTAIDEANTAIAEAEETGDENQVAVAQAMAADIPTTRMEMVSETQIEEEIIQAEELAENILDSDTAKEYTLDFANYAEPEIVESTEISESSTVDTSSSETLETQTSSITEEQTSSSEAETLQTTETSVEETGNSSQEDAVASKDDDESQKESATVVPFSAARRLRSASVDEGNPFDIQTEKRARLATVDGEGNTLTAKEAWDARLYEIQLDVSSIAVPGEVQGDIIMYIDCSGSFNGKDRLTDNIKVITDFLIKLGSNSNIRIAFVPMNGTSSNPSTFEKQIMTYLPISQLLGTPTTYFSGSTEIDLAHAILKYHMQDGGSSMDLVPAFGYANSYLLEGKSPMGIVVGGHDINDNPSSPKHDAIDKHKVIIGALQDENKTAADNKLKIWQNIVTKDESGPGGYLLYTNVAGSEEKTDVLVEALDKLREMMVVESFVVQDTVSEYFDVIWDENNTEGLSVANNTVTFSNQKMTNPIVEDGRYTWSNTFLIKAKDDFVGGNFVPTNVPLGSFVLESGDNYYFDQIYGESLVPGIDTPYVNVRVMEDAPLSEETILLGETATAEATIISNWTDWDYNKDFLKKYRDPDDGSFRYGIEPKIVFSNTLDTNYNANPTEPTIDPHLNYSSYGKITAGNAIASDIAVGYANGYGTLFEDKEVVSSEINFVDIEGSHLLKVLATKIDIAKTLDENSLPIGFSATFTMTTTPDSQMIGSVEISNTVGSGTFSGLGIGSYEITETLPDTLKGIKDPTVLNVVITRKDDTPSFRIMINGVEHEAETYIINNETKGLNLNILKREAGTENPINGVVFTLIEGGSTPGTDYTTQGNGEISIATGVLVAGKTYTLVEKTPANGFLPHGITYTITVDDLGTVTISDGTTSYTEDTENISFNYENSENTVVDLTVFNNRKGALPATGGQGIQSFMFVALVLMVISGGLGFIYVHRNRKGGA